MIKTLNFPSCEFTHTELAIFNGQTNQQVWIRYQRAIKDGTIVSAGTRATAGKGKPSKLWKLNSNNPTPVVAVSTPAPVAVAPAPVVPTVVPTEAIVVPAAAPVVTTPEVVQPVDVVEPEPAKLPEATPAAAPVVESPVIVEVLKIEPSAEVKTEPAVKDENDRSQWRTLKEVCPICKHPLSAIDDANGVMVWCSQGNEVCPSSESPFGHGRNEKDAYETLVDKWTKLMKVS